MRSCPFCGGLNLEVQHIGDGADGAYHFVVCNDCELEGPNTKHKVSAENSWNRRVNPGCTECEKNKRKLVVAISRMDTMDQPWRDENFRLHMIIEDAKKMVTAVFDLTDARAENQAVGALAKKLEENHACRDTGVQQAVKLADGTIAVGRTVKLDASQKKELKKWIDKELGINQ